MPYLLLDGTSGTFATAPYRSEYNEANVVDLRVEIDYNAYTTGQTLIARWSGVSLASPWHFILSNATPITRFRDASATQHQIVGSNFTLSAGTRTQLRTTIDIPSAECKFWQRATGTALTVDSGWSQVGATAALTATEIQQPTETPIMVGAFNSNGSQLPATGKVYRAVVKKSALSGGTLIFDADFEDTTTWTFA